MTKRKSKINWYSLDNILKHDVQYYIIFGERSNGKSFAVDTYIIDKFFEDGSQFAFLKRYKEDLKGQYMEKVFSPLEEYLLEKYNHKIKFYRGTWYLYEVGTSDKISDCAVFGHAIPLAEVNRTKAVGYPKVNTILFEEFMSVDCSYLNDEVNYFINIVSTIVRHRTDVKIFMLANAISKYSPYSSALKVKLHRMKHGEIQLREYKLKGLTTKFAIERSENVNVFNNEDNKKGVCYNVFGDSGVGKMITTGEFETHAYPRRVDNVTFDEYRMNKNDKIIGRNEQTSVVIRFEDYFYRIYLYQGNKYVLAFREIEEENIREKNTTHVINGTTKFINGITNIKNLAYYDDIHYNEIFNIIVSCLKQRDFITLNDDDGENIFNGFRLSGINLVQE